MQQPARLPLDVPCSPAIPCNPLPWASGGLRHGRYLGRGSGHTSAPPRGGRRSVTSWISCSSGAGVASRRCRRSWSRGSRRPTGPTWPLGQRDQHRQALDAPLRDPRAPRQMQGTYPRARGPSPALLEARAPVTICGWPWPASPCKVPPCPGHARARHRGWVTPQSRAARYLRRARRCTPCAPGPCPRTRCPSAAPGAGGSRKRGAASGSRCSRRRFWNRRSRPTSATSTRALGRHHGVRR